MTTGSFYRGMHIPSPSNISIDESPVTQPFIGSTSSIESSPPEVRSTAFRSDVARGAWNGTRSERVCAGEMGRLRSLTRRFGCSRAFPSRKAIRAASVTSLATSIPARSKATNTTSASAALPCITSRTCSAAPAARSVNFALRVDLYLLDTRDPPHSTGMIGFSYSWTGS